MTYNFDDEDNSWLDASLEAVPVKAAKTKTRTTSKGFWKMSPEVCAKISAALKGRKQSAEHIAKMRAALKGRTTSAETRAKQSAAHKGRKPVSAETRAKLSAARKSRQVSAETRAKMSASLKGRQVSAETRAKLKGNAAKPIMTPTGVFPSQRAAIDWATQHGLINATKKITKWLKTHPELFYYVPKVAI